MNMYCIKDEKTGVFFHPYFMTHDVMAKRMFQGTIRRRDSLLREFPEDYALYRIGTYDENTGMVQQDGHERLGFAFEFIDDDDEEEPG